MTIYKDEPLPDIKGWMHHYVSLEHPPNATGRKRLAEAIRYMKVVIRSRQNTEADFLDNIGEAYDWDNELMKRWMPSNGAYYPEISYERKQDDHD